MRDCVRRSFSSATYPGTHTLVLLLNKKLEKRGLNDFGFSYYLPLKFEILLKRNILHNRGYKLRITAAFSKFS